MAIGVYSFRDLKVSCIGKVFEPAKIKAWVKSLQRKMIRRLWNRPLENNQSFQPNSWKTVDGNNNRDKACVLDLNGIIPNESNRALQMPERYLRESR